MMFRCCLVCLPLLLAGCSWAPYAYRNICGASMQVAGDACLLCKARQLAHKAWQEVAEMNPELGRCLAYQDGFYDGFVGHVDKDGTGDPPAIPPRRFRYPVLRTPEEQQAVEDWYAGYRHGAQVAQEERWRDLVVVPMDLPPRTTPRGYGEEFIPYPPPPATPPAVAPPIPAPTTPPALAAPVPAPTTPPALAAPVPAPAMPPAVAPPLAVPAMPPLVTPPPAAAPAPLPVPRPSPPAVTPPAPVQGARLLAPEPVKR
jgi:hypothetical protein